MFRYQWFLWLFLTHCLFAQTATDSENLLRKGVLLYYNDPDRAIALAGYVFANSNTDDEKANALVLLAESEAVKGDCIAVIENLQKANLYSQKADNVFLKFKIAGLLAIQYRLLGFYEKGKQSRVVALDLSNTSITVQQKELLQAAIFREDAFILLNEKKRDMAAVFFKKAIAVYSRSEKIYQGKTGLTRTFNDLGELYLANNQIDSAASFFNKTLSLARQFSPVAAFKVNARNGLARILFLNGKYQQSADTFSILLTKEKIADPFLKTSLYKNLSDSYMAQENIEQYKLYNAKYKDLVDSIYGIQKKARLFIAAKTERDQQEVLKAKKTYYYFGVIAIFLVLSVLFLGSYLYHLKTKREYKRFQEIMNSLENGEKLKIQDPIVTELVEEEAVNRDTLIIIPKSSIRMIMEKLNTFEESTRYTDPHMSLQLLAKQLDTNTKYVSEIINKYKHKNFKAYINELRINYIVQKLKNDKGYLNYKTSYLAEECGFVSRSTFTTIFKSVTGLAPAKFIDFLKKEAGPRTE